jgi:hypothetical protein
MSERKSRGITVSLERRILALATLAALILALAGSSRAQSPSTASKSAPASASTSAKVATVNTAPATPAATPKSAADPAAPAKAAEAAKPGSGGIKIHGHWVLEVKNPDGKLVERREFDNSLVTYNGEDNFSTGDQGMTALLSGNATPGDPAIVLISSIPSGANPATLCTTSSGAECDFFDTGSNSFFPAWCAEGFLNCTTTSGLSIAANFSPPVSWVLSGSYTVLSNGSHSLSSVGALLPFCLNATSALNNSLFTSLSSPDRSADIGSKSCDPTDVQATSDGWRISSLTYQSIPGGPLAVVTGQVIQVSVTISFA